MLFSLFLHLMRLCTACLRFYSRCCCCCWRVHMLKKEKSNWKWEWVRVYVSERCVTPLYSLYTMITTNSTLKRHTIKGSQLRNYVSSSEKRACECKEERGGNDDSSDCVHLKSSGWIKASLLIFIFYFFFSHFLFAPSRFPVCYQETGNVRVNNKIRRAIFLTCF